jgi:hypothetical protein
MGTVYEAVHTEIGKVVAVKVLDTDIRHRSPGARALPARGRRLLSQSPPPRTW